MNKLESKKNTVNKMLGKEEIIHSEAEECLSQIPGYDVALEHFPDSYPVAPTVLDNQDKIGGHHQQKDILKPPIKFKSGEDVLQALISIATQPLMYSNDGQCREYKKVCEMERNMKDPLSHLTIGTECLDTVNDDKSRSALIPYSLSDNKDRDNDPRHPSSIMLLLKRRLHEEYRLIKYTQYSQYLDRMEKAKKRHEEEIDTLINQHRLALEKLKEREETPMPSFPVPTSKSISVLEKLLESDRTNPTNSSSRRLIAFWKKKYEKMREELIYAEEELMLARSEQQQYNILEGKDTTYLEKTLLDVEYSVEEERKNGDLIRKQLESQKLKTTTADDNKTRCESDIVSLSDIDIAMEDVVLLPESVSKDDVVAFSSHGFRIPSIREIGLRCATIKKENEELYGDLDNLYASLEDLECQLDSAQMNFCKRAGIVASNDEMVLFETLIKKKSREHEKDSARFNAGLQTLKTRARDLNEQQQYIQEMYSLNEKLESMKAYYDKEFALLTVNNARQRVAKKHKSGEKANHKINYEKAQLNTFSSTK